jgi:hypothetical protein
MCVKSNSHNKVMLNCRWILVGPLRFESQVLFVVHRTRVWIGTPQCAKEQRTVARQVIGSWRSGSACSFRSWTALRSHSLTPFRAPDWSRRRIFPPGQFHTITVSAIRIQPNHQPPYGLNRAAHPHTLAGRPRGATPTGRTPLRSFMSLHLPSTRCILGAQPPRRLRTRAGQEHARGA